MRAWTVAFHLVQKTLVYIDLSMFRRKENLCLVEIETWVIAPTQWTCHFLGFSHRCFTDSPIMAQDLVLTA